MDTQYSLIRVSGPMVPGLFHDCFFILGTGRELSYLEGVYSYTPVLSYSAGGSVRYYNEKLLFSVISGGFVFARGDDDKTSFYEGNTEGKSTQFLPVSDASFGQIFNPRLGNLMVAEISYSLKPLSFLGNPVFDRFQSSLNTYLFFRSSLGPVSEGGVDLGSSSKYLGTEIDLTLNFRPFSDLGLKSSTGMFFPSNNAFAAGENSVRFEEKLEFSFSF